MARVTAGILLCMAVAGCTALLAPKVETELTALRGGQYALDPNHATLLFKVEHMGLSTYVGRFDDFSAALDFDADNPSAARLDAVVRTASVDTNNAELEKTLRGASWFDVDRYPEANFRTVSVEPLTERTLRFTGSLTLLGRTAPVVLDVTFHGGARNPLTARYTLGFSATGSLRRSTFGMDDHIPLVGDEVSLEVHAEFQRR
jgi:polyisoprenoid-binding protein YceI